MTTTPRGSVSGNYVQKRKPAAPAEPDAEEEHRVPRLPELQFLKRRLPGEPQHGPWK